MSGPVVFTLGDKDYIAKLNQMSQLAGDVQAAKQAAETARTQAQQAVTQAQEAGEAEVAKAAQEVAKAAQIAADVQSVVATGIPLQTNNGGKVLKTDGSLATWQLLEVTDINGLSGQLRRLKSLSLLGV